MNETQIKPFIYEGNQITFETGNGVMVNATEMAKSFGKTPKDWLRTDQAKVLIERLSAVRQISLTELVTVNQGGNKQGTWMHEDVALVFAQWLSPDFYIWCNDRIKELVTTGVATVADDDAAILHAMQVLQRRVEEKDAQLASANDTIRLQSGQIEEQQKQIVQLAPKADYTDKVLQSDSTHAISDVAKELGMTGAKLYTKLRNSGVLFKRGAKWFPYDKYVPQGYFATRTIPFTHRDGSQGSNSYTVLTEKGRQWLHSLNIIAVKA